MRVLGLLAVLTLGVAALVSAQSVPSTVKGGRVYEMRTYYAAEGKLEALHERFRGHTVALLLTPNAFKRALAARKKLVGLWSQTGSATVVELLADGRPDWVLIDTEHAPVDIGGVVDQLRVLDGAGVSALVRPVWNDPVVFKRLLDAGEQTLLVPYVQTAA